MLLSLVEHGDKLFPNLYWFIGEDGDGYVGVVPLQAVDERDGRFPARALQSTSRFDFLYGDALLRINSKPDAFIRGILRSPVGSRNASDVIRISAAPIESGLFSFLTSARPGKVVVRDGSSLLACGEAEEIWQASLSRNLRSQIRQGRQRLHKFGAIQYAEAIEPRDIERAFDRFLDLERAGYKASLNPLANEEGDREVLRALFRRKSGRREARILEMYLGDRLAASQLGIIRGGRLHLFKVAYDEAFSDGSPGTVLLAELLRRGTHDSEIGCVDCCVRQKWHDRWHPTVEPRAWGSIPNKGTLTGFLLTSALAFQRIAGRS